MSKITIRIEGDKNKTEIAALVTWALMKLGVRPAYEGDNRQDWQWLASDEMELERKVRAMLNDTQFAISENASPEIAELRRQVLEAEALIEKHEDEAADAAIEKDLNT